MRTALLLCALALIAGACGVHPNDLGPGTNLPPGMCDVSGHEMLGVPMGDGFSECVPQGTHDCSCEVTMGSFPIGVTDGTTEPAVAFHPAGAAYDDDERMKGCSGIVRYAWPDCATVAEVSAVVMTVPENDFGFAGDEDYFFNTCPSQVSMRVDPFTSPTPMEIRKSGSWDGGLNGRIHMEVQDCRLFNGSWHVEDDATGTFDQGFRPEPGDTVSVAGDWISDEYHAIEGLPGWTEIHEARIMAVTHPITDTISYSFVSSFFAEQTRQSDELVLDIQVPGPPAAIGWTLQCSLVGEEGAPSAVNQPAALSGPCGIAVDALDPPVGNDASHTCRVRLTGPQFRHEYNCQGACGVPFGGCGQIQVCDMVDEMGFPVCHWETDCTPSFFACSNLAAVFAVRAEWVDPGDVWQCSSCGCDDPSSSGASIVAPVEGCVMAGLDPANPADQEAACAQVCGGLICGEGPACVIGQCRPPDSGGQATLIGRNGCDPTVPRPLTRVTPAGDWHVTLGAGSTVTIAINDSESTQPVSGEFVFNISADGAIVDFARAQADIVEAFEIADHEVTEARVFVGQRIAGAFVTDTEYEIPAGTGVFGVRGRLDGTLKGFNVTNPAAITGRIDLAAGTFELDLVAEELAQSDDDVDKAMNAHLIGFIDDVPPVAVSGGPTRTVECTSYTTTPVVLDGSASYDPDAGDAISHYQWFTSAGVAVGNQAQELVDLTLGDHPFVLHAYDIRLGSDKDNLTVSVVDTTPPVLTLDPTSMCMFPPNHERIKFTIGQEIQATAVDVCDPSPTVRIVSVTSDEPDNGLGDGDTAGDISFSDHSFCVRRERSGTGDGRQYNVVIEARDSSGNASSQTLPVRVPHDLRAMRSCHDRGTSISADAACE